MVDNQETATGTTPRRVRVIFRPDDQTFVDRFRAALGGSRWVAQACPTDDAGEVTRLATACGAGAGSDDDDAVDAIAAVDGDGSLNLVAAGAIRSKLPVVAVPAGTVNLTSHLMGIDTPEDAATALISGTRDRSTWESVSTPSETWRQTVESMEVPPATAHETTKAFAS